MLDIGDGGGGRQGRNVLGGELLPCSLNPVTGYFRDGCCNTDSTDIGLHVVCCRVTQDFLEFSRARGNDLSTPVPEYAFPGLRDGDQWCLCAARWVEAWRAGAAPKVVLAATHERALELIPLALLQEFAIDLH